jgi:hypothetical protein
MKMPSFLTFGTGSEAAAREAKRLAELAVQYEEQLDRVWRCEREWKLDDRIAGACSTRRR